MQEKLKQISKIKLEKSINSSEKTKYEILNKILNDDKWFQKMKTNTAYQLLYDLGFKEQEIKEIYNELIFDN